MISQIVSKRYTLHTLSSLLHTNFHRLFFSSLLLIIFGVLLSTFSDGTLSSRELGIFKSFFILPIAFAFLFAITHQTHREYSLTLHSFAASAVVASIFSLGLATFADGITYDNRFRGFWESPNQLAMYIAPAVLLFWIFIRNKCALFSRNFDILALTLLSTTLLFTQSLGGILSIFFSILSLETWLHISTKKPRLLGAEKNRQRDARARYQENKESYITLPSHKEAPQQQSLEEFFSETSKRGFLKKILLKISFFAILLFVSLSIPHEKLASWASLDERSSIASRMMIWQSAWDIGTDHPLLGIGPGNFQTYYLKYQQFYPPYLEWAVPHPHNILLMFWLGSGLLGLLGFLAIVGVVLYHLFTIHRKPFTVNHSLFTIHYLLFTLLFWGFIDTPYWRNDLAVLFWLLVFFALSSYARRNHSHSH
jgi:O-antigen ligase